MAKSVRFQVPPGKQVVRTEEHHQQERGSRPERPKHRNRRRQQQQWIEQEHEPTPERLTHGKVPRQQAAHHEGPRRCAVVAMIREHQAPAILG